MGSPISNILSEIFLQNLEDKHFDGVIKNLCIKQLAFYVDDVIVIFDNTNTNEILILKNLNNIHKNTVYIRTREINTKKYHVFAPMGRFQLESIYLYFPPSSQWKIKVN